MRRRGVRGKRFIKGVASVLKWAAAAGLFGGMFFAGAEARPSDQPNALDKLKSLGLREIGPAVMGGRIDDFAVADSNPNIVFVGVAARCGEKNIHNDTTGTPAVDQEEVYTLGGVEMDPS